MNQSANGVPWRAPTERELQIAESREERRRSREERLRNQHAAKFQPKESSKLVKLVEDELEPLVQAELDDIRRLENRDQRFLRMLALKAMLGSRVSGVTKGMQLFERLKRVVPSDQDLQQQGKKKTLDELETGGENPL